jgi:hypothetical protein
MPTLSSFSEKRLAPTLLHCIPLFSSYPLQCNPTSTGGNGYIIVVIDYFTKLVEVMPTFLNDGYTSTLYVFNHIITCFCAPQAIFTDQGSHFQNQMMNELHVKLGFLHEKKSPYYPQANKQVEAINKVLKMILQCMVGSNKSS